jgi:hypothetical protein
MIVALTGAGAGTALDSARAGLVRPQFGHPFQFEPRILSSSLLSTPPTSFLSPPSPFIDKCLLPTRQAKVCHLSVLAPSLASHHLFQSLPRTPPPRNHPPRMSFVTSFPPELSLLRGTLYVSASFQVTLHNTWVPESDQGRPHQSHHPQPLCE